MGLFKSTLPWPKPLKTSLCQPCPPWIFGVLRSDFAAFNQQATETAMGTVIVILMAKRVVTKKQISRSELLSTQHRNVG